MPWQDVEANEIPKLAQFIDAKRNELLDRWREAVGGTLSPAVKVILSESILSGQDLVSMLHRIVCRGGEILPEDLAFHVEAVRRRDYSLADLSAEVAALDYVLGAMSAGAYDDSARRDDQSLTTMRNLLSQVFHGVVQKTAAVYEQIIENGNQATCLLDGDGLIEYANPAMLELLDEASLAGVSLLGYVDDAGRAFLSNALRGDSVPERFIQEVELIRSNGGRIPVTATVYHITLQGRRIGECATFSDNSDIFVREHRFFDGLSLPAIKLDRTLKITYANPATMALLGTNEAIKGRSIFELLGYTSTTQETFEKRRSGKGDTYEAEIVRHSDGKRIPIEVVGTPVLDDQQQFIGSLGIVRNLEKQKVSEEIHKLIDTERSHQPLLEGLAKQLQRLMPVDYFGVNEHSRDGAHVCLFYSYAYGKPIELSRRWWPIPSDHRMAYERPLIADLPTFIREIRPAFRGHPDVEKFRDYHAMARFPITEAGLVVASVTVLSTRPDSLTESDLELLRELPVEQAVQMARYYKARRKFQFRYDLFKAMTKCATARELAKLLAEKLAEHYEWHHVAIFRAADTEKKFSLMAQVSVHDLDDLPSGNWEQSISTGVLGKVFEAGTPLNIPDLLIDDLRATYVEGWKDIRSVLCLPVVWQNKIQWLVDVEDERTAAFSQDEEDEVVTILDEASLVIANLSSRYLLESAFASSSDAVMITDNQSNIVRANPASARLLHFQTPEELNGPFEAVFANASIGRRVFEAADGSCAEVDLVRKDGTSFPVLISGSDLPEDLSRKIFVSKDLTMVRRLQQLESLGRLFQEVALQSHPPLALAGSWLRTLRSNVGDEAVADYCGKTLRQLKKAEISYDRLALFLNSAGVLERTHKQLLDVCVELKRTISEFPLSEAKRINLDCASGSIPYISLDPGQVSFMFSTILAYLIRASPEGNEVDIRLQASELTARVTFSALVPADPDGGDTSDWIARARFELALGDSTIAAFALNNCTTYRPSRDNGRVSFELHFGANGETA